MLVFYKRILISIIVIWYLSMFVSLSEARTIVIIYGGETCITEKEAKHRAIIDALLADTEEYLLCKLPQTRRAVIGQYLGMISQGLVSKITAFEPTILDDGRVKGIFDVPIRKKALYNLLREFGTPYTLTMQQPYILQYVVPDEEVFLNKISLLEDVSGVIRKAHSDNGTSLPILQVMFKEGSWSGVIVEEKTSLQASGNSLDNVWREIWGKFFSKRHKEASNHIHQYFLEISGWKHTSDIEELTTIVKHWETSVQSILLHEIILHKGAIRAQWTINVIDTTEFEEQIKRYTLAHKLKYTVHVMQPEIERSVPVISRESE